MIETPNTGNKWGKTSISYYVGTTNLPSSSVASSVKAGLESWNYVSSKVSLYEGDGDIHVYFSNDSVGVGILADTGLTVSGHTITGAEIRVFVSQMSGKSYQRILCHETGHALGLAHFDGTLPSAMNSYYEDMSSTPQHVDIEGLNTLYG